MIDPYEAYTNQKQWIESNLVGNLSAEAVDRKPAGIPIGNCNKCASLESEITKPAKFAGYANIESGKVKGLTEHQYFICNRSVLSFVFAIREWSKFPFLLEYIQFKVQFSYNLLKHRRGSASRRLFQA
jgi:hypothetical protein